MIDSVRSVLRRAARRINDPDSFLKNARGVIHVGANTGQERAKYDQLGVRVLWIEPIPEVFEQLESNIASYPQQKAVKALLTDVHGSQYNFNIASNGGASSSILDLDRHSEIWPEITYTEQVTLTSTTLTRLLADQQIDPTKFDSLIMDTQGSEMLVLKGAEELLLNFKYIKSEVADFESYQGCAQLSELTDYLQGFGFTEVRRSKFAERKGVGSYYDVVYRRIG